MRHPGQVNVVNAIRDPVAFFKMIVIPAQAGLQLDFRHSLTNLDPRLRGDDTLFFRRYPRRS